MAERRICGGCTACCKAVGVQEIEKPAGKWCPNCSIGKGCSIYEARPASCRNFKCLWLCGVGPVEDRPDRVRFVCEYQTIPEYGQVLCMFEVSEGALRKQAARTKTKNNLLFNTPVMYFPVRGDNELYLPPNVPIRTIERVRDVGKEDKRELVIFLYNPDRF